MPCSLHFLIFAYPKKKGSQCLEAPRSGHRLPLPLLSVQSLLLAEVWSSKNPAPQQQREFTYKFRSQAKVAY